MPEISGIGVLTAFLAGLVSFVSPCVLPLVPAYVSYVAGQSLDVLRSDGVARARLPAVGLSACFVLGFSLVFVAMGASATALGRLVLAYRYEATVVGGAVIILFGLFLMGLLRPAWLEREFRFHGAVPGGRPLGAFALGLAFAFGWTPCIGPVLGAILTLSATSAAVDGVALLSVYSLGLGVPFLVAAAFTDGFLRRMKALRRVGRPLQVIAGAVMLLLGVAMITGYLSSFSFWLLDTFPVFGRIG
ncbi:MAG: cytochrome c biogenesis CcdA family protein [Alphaproteobacteria bacterium]